MFFRRRHSSPDHSGTGRPFAPPAGWIPPEKTIVVVGTPRSGSTLLCSLMSQTGGLGQPDEFFKKRPLEQWGISPAAIGDMALRCRTAVERGSTPNGVCGIKLFAYHLARVQEEVSLPEWFPHARFVHIHREDLLAQAISFTIAKQTRRFHGYDRDRGILPEYSAARINERLEWFTLEEARWREYFARTGIVAHPVSYEEMVRHPAETIAAVGEFAGVEVDPDRVDLGRSEVSIQRSDINAEWRARFIRDCGDPSRVKKHWELTDGRIKSTKRSGRRLFGLMRKH